MPFPDATVREAERLVRRYPVARSALLPLLHLVQSVEGYVSEDGIAFCAEVLALTKAEVGAVASFYTMFKREPFGDYLLSVCTNPTCQIAGAQEIYEGYVEACGGHVDTEGAGVMVEHAECLGICDAAPVVQINYENYSPPSKDEAMQLLEKARAGEPPESDLSGHAPATFKEVERDLSGIEDGIDEYLIEAARLQATAAAPPSYRTGETDIPVTHPGGDPAGHGGDAFRAESSIGRSPLRERATEEDKRVAEELAPELRGEAAQMAQHLTGEEDDQPVPTVEEQPELTDQEVAAATGEPSDPSGPSGMPEPEQPSDPDDPSDAADRSGASEPAGSGEHSEPSEES
jgi:NADH-quinone oxidoreductase subunit E